MKDVQKTGFLSDYSQLKPGGDDRAALYYIKPGVDLKPYNKLMFERFVVLLSDSAEYREIDPAMLKELTDYYQNAVFTAVKDGYEIVDQPGPGVLRVRVAITQLKPSNPTPIPCQRSSRSVWWLPERPRRPVVTTSYWRGRHGIRDARFRHGERLAAAVDKRQGGKGVFRGKWEDTKEAFDTWAKRFRLRLDEARGVK